jgi:hypothetical protein
MSENVAPKGTEALVLALAAGRTIAEAASEARVSSRTANRRLQDEAFRQRVKTARSAEMTTRALGMLADAAARAVAALDKLLTSPAPSIRISAARSILEFGQKLREGVDHEERLAVVEARLAEKGKL